MWEGSNKKKHKDSWTLMIKRRTRKVNRLRCIPECGSNENRRQTDQIWQEPQSCSPEDALAGGQVPEETSGSCFLDTA